MPEEATARAISPLDLTFPSNVLYYIIIIYIYIIIIIYRYVINN